MNNASITTSTVKVYGSFTGFHDGSISYGSNNATFDPTNNFKPGEIVTVTVTTGVENASNAPLASPYVFMFTVDAPAGNGKFRAPVNYTAYGTGSGNHYSVLADFDNDGDIDIATTISLYNIISVMLNNGDGTYASAVTYPTLGSNSSFDISAADVDGDGDMDLLVANNNAFGLSVFLNNGSGGFGARNDYDFNFPQSNAQFLVTVDIDGDGDIDVVANDLTYNYLHVMKNNGSGVFTSTGTDEEFTTKFGALACGDLDKDGDMDIVASCPTVDSVEYFINDGTGNLSLATRFYWTHTNGPTDVLVADINSTSGDKQDLIYLSGGSDYLTYFKDNGAALNDAAEVSVGGYPVAVKAADVDTDNDLDLLVANYNNATFSLLTNTGSGTGTFTQTTYSIPNNPDDLSTADIDGDGDMDIVTINSDATVSVFQNYNGGHVSSITPVNGSINTDSTTNVVVVFDENINSSTLTSSTVKLIGSVSGVHSWTLSSYNSGTYTATIDPSNNFKPGEVVTVSVTTGVQNGNSIALEKGYSSAFIVGAAAAGTLGSKTDYAAGDGAQAAVFSDLNADGYPDIVAANFNANNVSVFMNNGDGTYAAAVNYAAGTGPASVAAGDVDSDGDIDLVVVSTNDNALTRLLNAGNGTFGAGTQFTTSTGPNFVALADIDADGDLDAVYTTSSYVWSQKNNGSGSFSSEENGNNALTAVGVSVADVDNDGDLDFVTVNNGSASIRVSYFNGSNWYASGNTYTVGTSPTSVVTGDFNNDGYIDAVTANLAGGNGTISYLQNNQSGGFNSNVDYLIGTGSQPRGLTAMDIDGDGDLDLAVANGAADSVVIFTNNGSGSFTKGSQSATGDNPYAIASADIDGDGDMDIVTANNTGDNISVLKGTSPVQISSISPAAYANNSSVSSDVVITFNQSMNAGTLNSSTIIVSGSQHGIYAGSYGHSNGVLTFNPAVDFKAGEVVTVLVTTGVQNPDGAALSSPYQWSFVAAASAEGTFGDRQNYTLNGNPNQSVTADMNGDGASDVVTITSISPPPTYQNLTRVEVSLNNGSGVLGTPDTTYLGSDYANALAATDVDGDGDLDVVLTTYYGSGGDLYVLLNDGAGHLSAPVTYYAGGSYRVYIGPGDLNGDGYNDLVVVLSDLNRVKMYLNNGSGGFSVSDSISTGLSTPSGIAISDVDGDGDVDILTDNYDNGTVALSKNNGNGTFAAVTTFSAGITFPDGIAAGDLNGDGAVDLAVSGWDSGQISALLNSGSGAFSTTTAYTNNSPSQIKLADMDGDGDLDIVTTEASIYKVSIRANNGSGTLSAASLYSIGNYPKDFSIADMDGDGDLDIVIAKDNSSVSVIKNIELVKVNSTSPTVNAINIDKTSNLTATFNVDMNFATLVDTTVIVQGSITGKIAGVISYDSPSKTLTFNPTNDFLAGEVISMILTTDIKNSNGINLHDPNAVTFTVHADGNGNFAYKDSIPDYPVSYSYINLLNSGDVTGDGKSDLLGAYGSLIKVFKNNTTSFDSISNSAITNTQFMPLADLDNDGDLDMVQTNYSNNNLTVLLNDGNGNFTSQTPVNTGVNSPKDLILKDMDNDGNIDATLMGSGSQQIFTFYNDGTGIFSNSNYSYINTGDYADNNTGYQCADVNNDGLNDVLLHYGNKIKIILNTGDRAFGTPVDYTISSNGSQIKVADVNGDGSLDLVFSNGTGNSFSVMLNNGDGTFGTAVSYALGYEVYQIETGDMDGDGDLDVVVRGYDNNTSADKLIVAYNNGSGLFANQLEFDFKSGAPDYYYGYSNLTLLDIDNDGDLDIAVHANHYNPGQHENTLLFENTSGSATAPTTAASGITTGNNYGTSINLSWTNGNGSHRLVVVKQGSAVDATPSDNSNFSPNTQFGSGTQIGTGNYAVFGGVGSSVTVTGLSLNTTYYVSVFEMNGIPGSEKVLTTSVPTASFTTNAQAGYPFGTTAGSSISFNGSSSAVDLPISTVPGDLTVEMWVKVTDSSSVAAFFTRGQSVGGGPMAPSMTNLESKRLEKVKSHLLTKAGMVKAPKLQQHSLHATSNNSSPIVPAGIMSNGDADDYFPIQVGINNGHFYASVYDDNLGSPVTVSGNTVVNSNQWYHIAFTMSIDPNNSDGYYHLYVNGNADADSQYVSYFYDYGSVFGLGYDGSAYFNGQIDEVQIRNTIQSVSQIRASIHKTVNGFPTDILGYWQFNEGTGNTSANLQDNTYDASLISTAWETSTIPLGGGTSTDASVAANTTGTQTIGNVQLDMSDGFDNPTDVVVSEVTAPPSSFPTNFSSSVGDKYFIIDAFPYPDSGTFSATLTLTYGAGVLTDNNELNYTLYKRSSTSDGSWTSYGSASAVNISTGEVTWTNIASFSQAIVVNQNDALPVEMSTFSATSGSGSVELQWKTETELNNYGFEIERKAPVENKQENSKARTWVKAGFVEGHGTTNAPKEYTFTDKNLKGGTYTYRLKQIDRNGGFAYSQQIEVTMAAAPSVLALGQNYPNPFNPMTTLAFTIPSDGMTTLKIYNTLGQEVATLVNEPLKAGEYHQVQFNASALASGVYFARLQSSNQVQLKKMLLLK
jgi:hypothetical protein